MPFRPLLLSTALGAALAAAFVPAQAQNSVDPSPTAAQTVKAPPTANNPTMKPGGKSTAASPTVTQTIKPGSGNEVTTPAAMATTGSATDSPTMKQRSERRKARRAAKKAMPVDNSAVGGGSSGTVPGRVENSTNSNSAGAPGKTP